MTMAWRGVQLLCIPGILQMGVLPPQAQGLSSVSAMELKLHLSWSLALPVVFVAAQIVVLG